MPKCWRNQSLIIKGFDWCLKRKQLQNSGDEVINKCQKIGGYTIKGIIIDRDYYNNVTKSLKSGAIITFKVDDKLIKNLDNIIKYILKKGYTIKNLYDHIEE